MFPHFMPTPQGDVYEPDGYSLALSKALVTLVVGQSPEYAERNISLVTRYLNRPLVEGEDPRAPLEEPAEQAVERFSAFMASLDCAVVPSKKANREKELEVLIPEEKSTVHAQQVIGTFRQFYQLCGSYKVGNRTAENPIELPGWHLLEEDERRASWCARYPKRPYGWLNAGLRFRVPNRKVYIPLIEDPTGCGPAMTKAVIAYGCPRTVIAICIVLEENGCRWREAAHANALGWSIKGFGPIVYTSNKHDGKEFAKQIALRPDVHSDTVAMFEAQPHPTDPDKTRMDHLRELAAAGDKAALRAIPLFPNKHGRKHKHRTFNGHWFRPAMEAWVNEDGSNGLLIYSDIGSRRPTPHWYRHARISRELEKEIEGLSGDAEVLAAAKRVCRRFKLKTDQAKRYAASLMTRIAEEENMREVLGRRAEVEAQRAGVTIPPTLPRQILTEAERLVLALPARRKAAA